MRRSNNKKHIWEGTAIIYCRLSRDDDLEGESYSIANQRKLLTKAAKDEGYTKIIEYCDDGISGVTMNRPAFNQMIESITMGKASAVFVKDLSRLGRNYIEVGKLTEEFFPEHNIRFIAVSDGIDTAEGENEFAPIKNLFNEWYARDISKKRRISNKIKGTSGEPLGQPPYGYKKDPDNKKHWLIDDEPAKIIRWIDSMRLSGMGSAQICNVLEQHKILTPIEYAISKGYKKPTKSRNINPYNWNSSTVHNILTMQEYCGDIINFKTYSISYKNKKRHENSPENMVVFKEVNTPIRSRETYEKLQKIGNRKPLKSGEHNMFSGLLVCSDCGSTLHYHFNQNNPTIKYFSCSGYNRGKRKICQSTHYIRVDLLEQIVLGEVRRLTRFACKHEEAFTQAVANYSKKVMETDQKIRQSELRALMARDKELDVLFERIYEDNISGKISDDRFRKLSHKYEAEQESLTERIDQLKKAFDECSFKVYNTETFVNAVKKYTRVKKLTPRMLTELIEKIEVFQYKIKDGVKTQKVLIHYNCIGSVEIPDELDLPEPQIEIKTRKGVTVNYGTPLAV